LSDLDVVLLTHAHADHVDPVLWSQLSHSHCHWIVPEYMVERLAREAPLSNSAYTVAVPGRKIAVAGITVTPFEAPHYEHRATGEINHVDSTGYFVETVGGSYLLPSDIRTYDPDCLRPFANVSVVFAHVFLGRSAALVCDPPLLNAFVDFYLSCRPKRVVLSHLYELVREPENCWLTSHARAVAEAFRAADSEVEIAIPQWYTETLL
jgi:phosphoribosyl 1,2-cyclic phosphodiesterase